MANDKNVPATPTGLKKEPNMTKSPIYADKATSLSDADLEAVNGGLKTSGDIQSAAKPVNVKKPEPTRSVGTGFGPVD